MGAGWIQEVGIDFEDDGEELEYETDDFGYQLMAGLRWQFASRWVAEFEYRVFQASDVELTSRTGSVLSDYTPVSLGLPLSWGF